MAVDVLIGLQWGDEGKGKIVDYLAPKYDIVARFQGGPNAGHTLVVDGEKIVLHTVPSGILQNGVLNLIGNGVVINPITLQQELKTLQDRNVNYADNLFVSEKAHLILPTHKALDAASEAAKGKAKIGSTLRGIGPTYMDKTGRNGLRVGDILSANFEQKYKQLKEKHYKLLSIYDYDFNIEEEEAAWFESIEKLRQLNTVNGLYFLHEHLKGGADIMAEGAQGTLLDVDFGTYPFVTSSNTITASACKGLGIAPNQIREVIGISKAYCTRVGSGPFPTELFDETGEALRKAGHEFGATTGRPRRCGWIDLVALKYACIVNGTTQIALTKADILNTFETLSACTEYEINGQRTEQLPFDICDVDIKPIYSEFKGWNSDVTQTETADKLPKALTDYIAFLETYLETPISMISTGPERERLIHNSPLSTKGKTVGV